MSARGGARLGAVLIALGILGILWGVFHVLAAVQPPASRDFAARRPYDEVKGEVQAAFPGGLLRALAGLGVALAGGRVRRRALEPSSTETPPT